MLRHYYRILLALVAVFALTFGSALALAQAGTEVTWMVAASDEYTVTNNGAQPLIEYNDCLATNTTYTIDFSVTVDADEDYEYAFATSGETTQFFDAMSFAPTGVAGAAGTQTFDATFTFQTGDTTFSEPTGPQRERFGIFLDADGTPVADSFLSVDIPCIQAGDVQDDQQDTGAGDDQQADMVTKTFQLSLHGDVPAGEAFAVAYGLPATEEFNIIVLCGSSAEYGAAQDECMGGTTYSGSAERSAGSGLYFAFIRLMDGKITQEGIFHSGTETLAADMTNSAWFRFEAAKDTQDDQQEMPSKLPNTGAGGIPGAPVPVGALAAVASVVAATRYGILRRFR